ncbi:SMI1/KNR4 family protein [Streptomyces peucetius]|uniref:SMI1/KNR4 family protein n=1 Tax=Streptomyces peucetius TaxID=1950 RepID=A0ABY6IDE0_STRPE|nr:SMI1/KNR4 family protein [Streptomyces peucetius]UYQ65015.1 SMI1/KNR4 family protein [Streptomyces peucetius]
MTETPGMQTLRQLMPPTAESDTQVDWALLGESWGKEFPGDHRQFIELYGAGNMGNYLSIVRPEPKGAQPESGGMLEETVNAVNAWDREQKAPGLEGASPELIAWGVDGSSDLLCWDASGGDPDRWPVLVFNRDDALWRRYDCGMTEFLVRVLRADFDECPLGDLSLWGKESAVFLNEREYDRLLEQGLDPWTGEPDPFAGMFD